MASYSQPAAVAKARRSSTPPYVLKSDWATSSQRQRRDAFLESHSWEEYAQCTCPPPTAPRRDPGQYSFVYGDFRRVHRSGLIACQYRAAEWRHKQVELAAHELLQHLDKVSG